MKLSDLAGTFAHSAVRKAAFVIVAALLAWCGIGKAQAADHSGAVQALAGCEAAKAAQQNHNTAAGVNRPINCQYYATWPNRQDRSGYSCEQTYPSGSKGVCIDTDSTHTFPKFTCPTGTTFDPLTAQCAGTCPQGEWKDPTNPANCLNADKCKAKPALGNSFTTGSVSGTACNGGCEVAPSVSVCTGSGAGALCSVAGAKATGRQCPAGTPSPTAPKSQECKPAGAGQTLCIKPNGDHCATSSAGKQICWKPGETGQKTDADILQKRNAGETPIPPENMQLPSGDNLQQKGDPITSTTTTTNNTTNTSTTINTTITNYQTVNGTDANSGTGDDAGQPGDGTGDEDGECKGDKCDDTAAGGGNCETPPIVGGDVILGMVATQAWATRCAVDAGNAASVTGDVGNCAQPFSVQGTNANAIKLRAMRAQICNGDQDGDGQPDWTKPDGTEGPDDDSENDGEPGFLSKTFSTDLLDTSGIIGGGTCPSLGTINLGPMGQFSLDSEPWFCDLVALMRGVLLLLGAFLALSILTGGKF